MKYPVIIFDWDGTLMDSIDKIITCVQHAADACQLPPPSASEVRHIIGLSLEKSMQTLFPLQDTSKHNEMIDAYRQQYLHINQQETPFYPGIRSWLQSLKDQGYLLAVATGKGRRGLNRMMDKYDVLDLFSVTYCADETCSKPDPLMLFKILETLDITAEQALMIGDSSYDLEMANNANIACVGVTYGVHDQQILSQFKPIAILNDLPSQLGSYI
ncbi:HAD family hydrolase [Psychromonas aquimarina]|uniref:HAD family hydrolase n=1 Tax=Psychromonas aquimarina TaxID=444919 RepID=UPI0004104E42|nr:HAD-IIIA family hydrolase [Psychromonas aquimarina]